MRMPPLVIGSALALILATGCDQTPHAPADLPTMSSSPSSKMVNPGDRSVEMGTVFLTDDSTTRELSFSILMPEGDSMGMTWWDSDPLYNQDHDARPELTQVQQTVGLCWLQDQHSKRIDDTGDLPNIQGEVSFDLIETGGVLTLLCDIRPDALTDITIGVTLRSAHLVGPLQDDGTRLWDDTYTNLNMQAARPARIFRVEEVAPTIMDRHCPSNTIESRRLQSILNELSDDDNQNRFDAWDGDSGSMEATFHSEGVYYKVFYSISGTSFVSFWERTDRPFVVGGDIDLEGIDTYTDDDLNGCANFGIGPRSPKMQWSSDGDPNYDWQVEYHGQWQSRYHGAVTALGATLGVN